MSARLTPRMVPDPSMTDAEFYHQQGREIDRVSRTGAKPNPNVGKVHVMENAMTRIGGLARIASRLDHHEKAAERFKAGYEALYGAGSPASDPSRVQVDTSKTAHDSGMAAKMDRHREIGDILDALGRDQGRLLVGVVVLCEPIKHFSRSDHSRDRKVTTGDLLMILDSLAVRWGYLTARRGAA